MAMTKISEAKNQWPITPPTARPNNRLMTWKMPTKVKWMKRS